MRHVGTGYVTAAQKQVIDALGQEGTVWNRVPFPVIGQVVHIRPTSSQAVVAKAGTCAGYNPVVKHSLVLDILFTQAIFAGKMTCLAYACITGGFATGNSFHSPAHIHAEM